MRRILAAKEYARLLESLSEEQTQKAAAAVAHSARELMARYGLNRLVFLFDEPLRPVAFRSLELVLGIGVEATAAALNTDALPDLAGSLICDLLLDPVGRGTVREKRDAWIEAVIRSGRPILSAAIPAGVDPDTGAVEHEAVCARITIALEGYLPGLFLREGLDHCGEIRPVGEEAEGAAGTFRFEASDAQRSLPPRKRTAHKGDSGKALLCVGSPRYVGAALLSARACLAAGCGILFVACPDEVRAALRRLPEAIGIPVGSDWNRENCRPAIRAMAEKQALGIGCGVGDGDVSPLLEAALKTGLPLVLDADGLNCLSRRRELFSLLHEKVVLTPHPGEMGRLTGLPARRVLEDPLSLADEFAHLWGCTVLLKGAATVVSDGKRTRLVAEGNAGLGKGGSGDVLTGIITGLLSQGTEPFTAACLGSYLLGASADRAFALLKERMLRATNVIEALEDWNE